MRNRLDAAFDQLKANEDKALITYLMAGDPSLQDTKTLVLELEQAGADVIELGVPFSDPIADGPVIQRAAERALRSGTSLRRILTMVAELRATTQIPLVLMAYYNTVHAFGLVEFWRQAVAAGVDGLIVPDMPPEESSPLLTAAEEENGLHLIFLLAPTSTPARRTAVARRSKGFVYYVSLTGITGAQLTDLEDVRTNVEKIRGISDTPVAVGFGIATANEAAQVAGIADGVIIGSAIVRHVEQHQHDPLMKDHVARFVRSIRHAMHGQRPVSHLN